ncbi:MAG: MerR family transcriptional regulator [Planctomycetota bacterium]
MGHRDYPRVYGFNEILELTGLKRSQLTHWADRGIVPPDVSEGGGPGHGRRYSFRNLNEFVLAAVLSQSLGWEAIRMTLEDLRSNGAWERLADQRKRSEAAILHLQYWFAKASPTPRSTMPAPTVTFMSLKQAAARVGRSDDVAALIVSLELILSTMEKKTGDTL